jgi:hypothetical protein
MFELSFFKKKRKIVQDYCYGSFEKKAEMVEIDTYGAA